MSFMQLTVLPMGQGTGTLIQRFEAQGQPPTSTVLVDLGSAWWRVRAGDSSADYVAQVLKQQANPTLNSIFLSHGDIDHVSRIKRLLSHFSPPGQPDPLRPTLTVESVFFGGPRISYAINGTDYLQLLEEYRPEEQSILHDLPINAGPRVYFRDHDLDIYLLAGNTVTGSTEIGSTSTHLKVSEHGYAVNTDSLILLIEFGDTKCQYAVLPGDATGFSLAQCCERLANASLPPAITLALPHHGSSLTTFDLLGAQIDTDWTPENLAQDNVDFFNDLVRPQTLMVSAGEVANYRHPSARMITTFAKYTTASPFRDESLSQRGEHFYTCHFRARELNEGNWPQEEGWTTVRTDKSVFTTDYFKGDPATTETPKGLPPDVTLASPPHPPFAPPPPRCRGWLLTAVKDDGFSLEPVLPLTFTSLSDQQRQTPRDEPQRSDHPISRPSGTPPPPTPPSPANVAAAPVRRPPSEPAAGRSTRLRPLI
ncbi:hypothetical protein [[Kitasatospora] papulosa]|uniref:hypothetical protein n=1 Tax=[Kitasatospora] papulosa TaxID=1464011 RepID=UPI0036B25C88